MASIDQRFLDTKIDIGKSLIYAFVLLLILFHVFFALSGRLTHQDLLFGWISPLLLFFVLAYVKHWSVQNEIGTGVLRLAAWMGMGIFVFGASGILVIVYQQALGGEFLKPMYSVLGWGTGGTIIGLVFGMYDVDRKIAMAQTVETLDHSERLSEQLKVYNRVFRHDVRTAANITMGYADHIADAPDSAEQSIRIINQQMERLTRLTEQSRKIAGLHDEELTTDQALDLVEQIDESAQQIQREYPETEINVETSPEQIAVSNRSLIIAVTQLLRNAVEHNTVPSPRTDVYLDHTGERLTLCVEDNGPGIPDSEIDILDKGFETQLEHSDGTGLWLVKWVVDDLGGSLSFDTDDSLGSSVTISLRSRRWMRKN
ncbi:MULTISPECIES: sensor histidine kinase KdpD [Haloferax]|uniref:histidine kinase n=2 Tax=Haloferax TaxID=2251 RepID=A0A6G1Z6F9_9EURY|nr:MULTISPECIES: HAMP domain-containing sensor histidine kinase [Haloferax]KAB1185344.1 HAMP domain-containing histidine kinase [Haloferax sp. CBA1149]MRW81981.1 hypothetical protein [Haloferax marinisediminis]